MKLSLINSSSSLGKDETSSTEDGNGISSSSSSSSSSSTSKIEDDFSTSKVAKEDSEAPEKSASSLHSDDDGDDKESINNDVGAIVIDPKPEPKSEVERKKRKKKKKAKKKSVGKRKEGDKPPGSASGDSAAHKAMLKKLVNGAKTGSSSKLKAFIKGFPAHDGFLSYGPLLEQADGIITMLVAMLKAPNNVMEALGALFCLTQSPVIADLLPAAEGGLSAVALFVTDTALVPKKSRASVDEYGIGVLSNVGHSADGKRRLVGLLPPPVFVRYFSAYHNRASTIKYAVNVLASVALVSRK